MEQNDFLKQAEKNPKTFCWFCGENHKENNHKEKLHNITVSSNKKIHVCSKCFFSLGKDAGVIQEFQKTYNPAETFSMSNLQLTTKVQWIDKKLKTLEQKIEAKA